jgi:hypothetical protein
LTRSFSKAYNSIGTLVSSNQEDGKNQLTNCISKIIRKPIVEAVFYPPFSQELEAGNLPNITTEIFRTCGVKLIATEPCAAEGTMLG